MKIFFITIIISLFTILNASSVIGLVQNVKGNVKVKSEQSITKSKVKKGLKIKNGDLITTSKQGTAVLKLIDGSVLALDVSSALHFKTQNNVEQTNGKVYYKITSRDAKNSLKIRTPFAIIGIKGTTFVVNATDKSSIKLQEGLIGVKSLKENFKLYRKSVIAEYNKYISKQESDFEKYKKKQKEHVLEITKEFDLHAQSSVSFFENEVNENDFTKADKAEFTYFKKMIEIK